MSEEVVILNMGKNLGEITEDEEVVYETRKRKNKEQDIGKNLEPLRLPEEIKIRAAEIKRMRMDVSTKRGSNLNKLIFFCVYNAYEELGITFDKIEIADICGINSKDIPKILRMFPEISTGYKAPIDDKSALYYVSNLFYITKLHKSKLQDVINLAHRILSKPQCNFEAFPENVAIGIILYYMDLNGVTYDINEIIVRYAISTINAIKKIIAVIDNS